MADEERLEAGKVMQFGQNIQHVGQQKQNRLVPYVTADLAFTEKGDRFTDETFGMSDPVEFESDWSDTPDGTVPQFRRVAMGKMYGDSKRCGTRERAEKLISPTDPIVMAMAFGRERRRDKVILERGIFAPSMQEITPDGDYTTKLFPASQIVAVDDVQFYRGKADGVAAPSTPTAGQPLRGLTPAKIRKAKKVLADGKNDMMTRPVLLYEEQDLQYLMTSQELTDGDLTTLKRLENGEINTWLGVDFVKIDPGNMPLVPGQTTRWYTAMYLREYILYKDRPLTTTRITERADKRFRWAAYYDAQDFTLRKQDSAFVWIDFERP